MSDCIFCKIINKEIPSDGIFYEDQDFMAFLSIFPSTEGFTVLVPKQHFSSDVLALPDEVLSKLTLAAKKVSKILLKHFSSAGRIGLIAEGTGINHAHLKLVPMHQTEDLKDGNFKPYNSGRSDYFDAYPGYLISTDGPAADPEKLKLLANQLKQCQ
jgi:diadenosine tetraphosphate (Ap4A) HIT family hydrolase